MFRDKAINRPQQHVRLLFNSGRRIQGQVACVTRESAEVEGAVIDESTEFGVWQQIINLMLATNGIWRALNETVVRITFPAGHPSLR